MSIGLISIILPVHNQADHIGAVVEGYESALGGYPTPYELILVANGNRDNSAPVCRDLAAKHRSVRVVESVPGGWGLAVKLGLAAAKGDQICYTNSARTTAEELLAVLNFAREHPDVAVKAKRTIREGWRRLVGSYIFNLECRILLGIRARDVNGTPKVFPRTFDKLLKLRRDDDLIDAEFLAICRRNNYPVMEIPIQSTKRHGGRSTTSLKSARRMYWGAVQLARQGVAGPEQG